MGSASRRMASVEFCALPKRHATPLARASSGRVAHAAVAIARQRRPATPPASTIRQASRDGGDADVVFAAITGLLAVGRAEGRAITEGDAGGIGGAALGVAGLGTIPERPSGALSFQLLRLAQPAGALDVERARRPHRSRGIGRCLGCVAGDTPPVVLIAGQRLAAGPSLPTVGQTASLVGGAHVPVTAISGFLAFGRAVRRAIGQRQTRRTRWTALGIAGLGAVSERPSRLLVVERFGDAEPRRAFRVERAGRAHGARAIRLADIVRCGDARAIVLVARERVSARPSLAAVGQAGVNGVDANVPPSTVVIGATGGHAIGFTIAERHAGPRQAILVRAKRRTVSLEPRRAGGIGLFLHTKSGPAIGFRGAPFPDDRLWRGRRTGGHGRRKQSPRPPSPHLSRPDSDAVPPRAVLALFDVQEAEGTKSTARFHQCGVVHASCSDATGFVIRRGPNRPYSSMRTVAFPKGRNGRRAGRRVQGDGPPNGGQCEDHASFISRLFLALGDRFDERRVSEVYQCCVESPIVPAEVEYSSLCCL